MKKIILSIVALSLVGFSVLNERLTDDEREKAITEMANTQNHMMATLEGLSEAQLNFKSTPESWSIAECVEHLAISEIAIFGILQSALQTPADKSMRTEVKMNDEELLGMIRDRSNKVKTSEAFEPSGKFGTYEETLNEFSSKRSVHIEYMKTTEDDLRNHYGQLPFGTVDAYQVVLFMSGHTERHVKQMEEIKADENFPME